MATKNGSRTLGQVLVVEEDEDLSDIFGLVLAEEHDVRCVPTGASALHLVTTFAPDVVLIDTTLSDMTAAELVQRLSAISIEEPQPSLILLSAASKEELAILARELRAVTALRKPFPLDDLLDGIATALSARRAGESGVFPRKAAPRDEETTIRARSLAS